MVKTVFLPVTSYARQLVSYVAGHGCTENMCFLQPLSRSIKETRDGVKSSILPLAYSGVSSVM